MTSVAINRVGTDQVTLELLQTGKNETSVNLRHNLLDDRLTYMFCVSHLSVPLNFAPINPVTGTEELFRVERRNVGHSQATQAQLDSLLLNPLAYTFSVREANRMYDVAMLIRDLASFCTGFNKEMSLLGIPDLRLYGGPHDAPNAAAAEIPPLEILPPITEQDIAEHGQVYIFLNIEVSADGSLRIIGTPNFWNNFVFRFRPYGAALLGLTNSVTDGYLARSIVGGNTVSDWFDPAAGNAIFPGNVQQEIKIYASHPLYQSADQRIKITVDSHLPMAGNIEIIDEGETIDRMIAEKFFETKLETSSSFAENGTFENMTMKSQLYSGQVSFIRKSDFSQEWFKLLTSYEVRYFRFHIYIWNRLWVNNKWKIVKKKLHIPTNKYWGLSLKFVSES